MRGQKKIARRKSRAIAAASMLAAIVAGGRADGADYIGGNNSFWSDPNNWSTLFVPASAFETANITLTPPGPATVTQDYLYDSQTGLGSVTVDGLGGYPVTLIGYAGLVTGSAYIGVAGKGIYANPNGYSTSIGALYLGYGGGSNGTYTLTGPSTSTVNGNAYVGYSGVGSFDQSTGIQEIGGGSGIHSFYFGYNAGSSGSYTLSGTGNLTVNGNEYIGLSGNGSFKQTGGRHAVSGVLDVAANPGSSGIYTISAGSLTMGTLQVNANGVFHYNGGTVEPITVQISDRGKVILSPGGGSRTLATYALSMDRASGTQLNLNDHALIVRDSEVGVPDSGVYNGVTGLIQSGFNQGSWDGAGIITGMADATAGLTSLGIATADQTGYSVFGGVRVSGGNILVMYTYAGDANLDGFISGDDYSTIDFNVGTSADGWYPGAFKYDGMVSGDDYSTIDFNYVAQGAPFPTSAAADAASVTAVPEPATIGLMMLALPMWLRRRRCGIAGL
ncbi:MAG: hypothetical protein QOE14_2422 [Humisphaera sp.]|nr:hypothetical protein [Humisphaera sp.]